MRLLFTVLFAFVLSITNGNAAESRAIRRAADKLVEYALVSLATPRRGDYRVGIVNRTHGIALLISRKDATAVVEVVHGSTSQRFGLITDALRQLTDPEVHDFSVKIVRKKVELANCPDLSGAILAFYSDLEAALSTPIRLDSPPPGPRLDPYTGAVMPVVTDGISYSVQVATEDAIVEVRPLGGYRPPLQKSVTQLEAVAMRCSYELEGTVQDVSGF